ncbi:MAG: hypothetical protein JWM03_733 [Rhodocyclales bacterium]|nr:hypothetical protein [Rhodocyclales bacterium]
MKNPRSEQTGMSLIVSLILLVVLTIIVITGVRGTTMNERMAGSNMERARAYQAAEQALAQGLAVLQTNSATCLTACTVAGGVGAAVGALPAAFLTGGADVATATGQQTSAKYLINQLPVTFLPAAKNTCAAYSVMGKGVGLNSSSVVVLQTVAFVCPVG